MTYQGPMLIREPELRWPVVLAALIITALVVLLTAGAIGMALATPAARPPAPQPLGGATLEPGGAGLLTEATTPRVGRPPFQTCMT